MTDPSDAALFSALFDDGLSGGSEIADLLNFQKAVRANDYWSQAGSALGSAKFDYSTWDPGTSLGVSAAQGFLSAMLRGYGADQEAAQISAVSQVLPALSRDPLSVERPEGVDADAFAALQAASEIRRERRSADQRAALAKDLLSATSDINKAIAIDSGKRTAEDAYWKKLGLDNPNTPAGKEAAAAAEAFGRIQGENAGWGSNPQSNPNSPFAKEADAARAEIAKLPAVTSLLGASAALSKVSEIKDLDTKSSDIPFVYAVAESLDPGSVVREGDRTEIQTTSPLLSGFVSRFNATLSGKSELGPDLKRQIVSELKGSQKSLFAEALRQAQPRVDLARQRGVTTGVYPFDPAMTFDVTDPIPGPVDVPTVVVKDSTGRTIRVPADHPLLNFAPTVGRGAPRG